MVTKSLSVCGWAISLVLLACTTFAAEPAAVPEPDPTRLLLSELIYDTNDKPTPQCHASTIVETSDGVAAAWFGGTREKNPDVGIWFSKRTSDGWSTPVQLADGSEGEDQEYACWNPVLFQPKSGPLMLFYKVGPHPRTWWGVLRTSNDDGKTWSNPSRLGTTTALGEPHPQLAGPIKNKPVQLDDGTIFCPSSTEHAGWRVHFEVSSDNGKSWSVTGPINDGSNFNAIQPSILTYADGRLQVLCRTREGVVAQSISTDHGKTWSAMSATSLPNPNSGTDAVTLTDGRQLLVYNHTIKGGPFPSGRNMINVAVSSDGVDWTPVITLEKERRVEFSYPAVIQTSDGKVHITYTWKRQSIKHVVLDPKTIPQN